MNNLEKAFAQDRKKYEEAVTKLVAELKDYYNQLEPMYSSGNYVELKRVSHNIRNIAGALGLGRLKMLSAFWEELCDEEGAADINEYRKLLWNDLSSLKKD